MEKHTVRLELEGKAFVLEFNGNVLSDVENETGVNLKRAITDLGESSVTDLRALLYGLILPNDPLITLKDVGLMVNFRPQFLDKVYTAIAELLGYMEVEEETSPR